MDEKTQQAQADLDSLTQEPGLSLDEIVAGLRGFGISELEEPLSIQLKQGGALQLRLANIPTSDEIESMLAAEGTKGYHWVKTVKIEMLSRAISWLNGKNLRALTQVERLVIDPNDGVSKDIQVVLRNLLRGWGQEVVDVLWKILMKHCQRIEDSLRESLPESAYMTEVEQRLFAEASKQIEAANEAIIEDSVARLYDPELDDKPRENK